jgi:hypothetical protein
MSDIKLLLDQTARSAAATPSPDTVESDVRRGRAALVRRRRRRAVGSSIASTVAAAAIVATAIVLGGPDGSSEAPTVQPDRATSPDAGTGVRLVTYTGEQPVGFIVELVPDGWYIQDPAHPAYSVTIAEEGDTSHPDGYVGKLVVMLQSSSVRPQLPENGDPVEVNGQPGVVTHGDRADLLTYVYPDGRYVEIQAWRNLGWSNDQLVDFAEGVTVTADAKAGIG